MTTNAASDVRSLLSTYVKEDLFRIKENYYDYFLSLFDPELGKALVESMAKSDVDGENVDDLRKYATELLDLISATPQVLVTLGVKPRDTFIATLYDCFQGIYNVPVLLNISYEPEILGGISVVYKGIYTDLTLKTLLDKYFVEKTAYVESLLQ